MLLRLAPLLLLLAACGPKKAPEAAVSTADVQAKSKTMGGELPPWAQAISDALDSGEPEGIIEAATAALDDNELDTDTRGVVLGLRGAMYRDLYQEEPHDADMSAVVELYASTDLPPGQAGAERLDQIFLARHSMGAWDAESDASIGSSAEQAVPVLCVSQEYVFIGAVACGPDLQGTYQMQRQTLREEGGHSYDVLDTRCTAGGEQREFWFDIDIWMSIMAWTLSGEDGGMPALLTDVGLDAEGAAYLMGQALDR